MEDCLSSDEDYYYSDRDSLDGLENEEADFQCAPPKGPSTKVSDFFLKFLALKLCLMVLELMIVLVCA
jgi:hypothetical protein